MTSLRTLSVLIVTAMITLNPFRASAEDAPDNPAYFGLAAGAGNGIYSAALDWI